MTPKFEDSPVVYFAYQRARTKAIQARVERKLGRRGGGRGWAGFLAAAAAAGHQQSRERNYPQSQTR